MAKVTDYVYQQFLQWFRSIYGNQVTAPPNDNNISESEFYKYWLGSAIGEAQRNWQVERLEGFYGKYGTPIPYATATQTAPEIPTSPEQSDKLAWANYVSNLPAGVPVPLNEWNFAGEVKKEEKTTEATEEKKEETRNALGYTPEEWLTFGRDMYELQVRQTEAMNEAYTSQANTEYLRRQQQLQSRGGFTDYDDTIRNQQFEEFENWRNRLSSQLTGPANSVARWFVTHKPNPYKITVEEQLTRAVAGWQAEYNRIANEGPRADVAYANEQIGWGNERRTTETPRQKQLAENIRQAGEAAEASLQAKEQETVEWMRGPKTPAWMSQFTPGVGEYLSQGKALNVQTPSPQQLNRLTPDQSDYLAGTIEYLGGTQSWRDAVARAEMMLPRNPARKAVWRPAIQGRI